MRPAPAAILVATLCALAAIATVHAAYRGHASDADVAAMLAAYPAVKGTVNDACTPCHRYGDVPDRSRPGQMRSENHCEFCHVILVAQKRRAADTLTAYGQAYLAAGRNEAAVRRIGGDDADQDGAPNDAEFAAGTNPGDGSSRPSAPIAPGSRIALAELRQRRPVIEQPVFINVTHNPAGDAYNHYRGVTLQDALVEARMLDEATAVDLISYDGYERTVTVDEMRRAWPQAAPVMGLSKAEFGPCGWVSYNAPDLKAGTPLPDARIMLAFEENGRPLQKARLDPKSGRIVGSGPIRLIVPQDPPSGPDQSEHAEPGCPEKVAPNLRFSENHDHNGGKSAFAIVAIRVKPLPKGTRPVAIIRPATRLARARRDVAGSSRDLRRLRLPS